MQRKPFKIRFIKMDVSETEKKFIEYCRAVRFADIELLQVRNGEPVKMKRILKSEEFDLHR
jgi:hypothetical protein